MIPFTSTNPCRRLHEIRTRPRIGWIGTRTTFALAKKISSQLLFQNRNSPTREQREGHSGLLFSSTLPIQRPLLLLWFYDRQTPHASSCHTEMLSCTTHVPKPEQTQTCKLTATLKLKEDKTCVSTPLTNSHSSPVL